MASKISPIAPGVGINSGYDNPQAHFWNRAWLRRAGATLVVLTAIGSSSAVVANAMEGPGPVVGCAGEGQVRPRQGFISAVQAADRDYRLEMPGSIIFGLGTGLADKAPRPAQPNEWVWIGRTAGGDFTVDLGRCPTDLPGPLPPLHHKTN